MVSAGKRISMPEVRLPGCECRPDRAVEVSLYRCVHVLSICKRKGATGAGMFGQRTVVTALLRSLDAGLERGYSRK
jgi:hypothetical protein